MEGRDSGMPKTHWSASPVKWREIMSMCETPSLKVRWRELEEYTPCQPMAFMYTHAHAHTDMHTHTLHTKYF